jgi:excisionase family DNA binding protein
MVSKPKPKLPASAIEHDEISVTDAAIVRGCSDSYIRRLLRKGDIEGWKIGPLWIVKASTLLKK